ncbi:MAG: hypothetical protein AB7I18_11345 [Candidatus Berkiella sp.]
MPKTELNTLPKDFVQQFIEAGSLVDEGERKQSCQALLASEQVHTLEQITELGTNVNDLFKEKAIDLLALQSSLQTIETLTATKIDAVALTNQQDLFDELTVADRALEHAKIEVFNRANVFKAILSYGLPLVEVQDDAPFIHNGLIYDAFLNINQGLICLVQRLLQSKLHDHDYYDCFKLIVESSDFIREHGHLYLDICISLLVTDVSKDRKIDERNPTIKELIKLIISCKHVNYFLQQHQQTANVFKITGLADRSIQVLSSFGVQFSITEKMPPEFNQTWLPSFQMLEGIHHNLRDQSDLVSSASVALEEELYNSLSMLNNKTALDGSDAVQFSLLVQHFMTRLKIYAEFNESCFSTRVLSTICEITTKIDKAYREHPQLCDDYFHHVFLALFRRVGKLLALRQQSFSNSDMNRISAAMAVLDLADTTSSTTVMPKFVDEFITACTEMDAPTRNTRLEQLLRQHEKLSFETLEILLTSIEHVFSLKKVNKDADSVSAGACFVEIFRANCFIAILDKCIPLVQETDERLLPLLQKTKRNLFKHLFVPLTELIMKFNQSQLEPKDYFETFVLIRATIKDVKRLAPSFHSDFVGDLRRLLSRREINATKVTAVFDNLMDVLCLYETMLMFMKTTNDHEEANVLLANLDNIVKELQGTLDTVNSKVQHHSRLDQTTLALHRTTLDNLRALPASSVQSWFAQLTKLEPLLIALNKPNELIEANADNNTAILASLTKYLQTLTHGPKSLSVKINELAVVLQNYVQYKPSSLPVSTVERVYRTTLGLFGELLKAKHQLKNNQHQCVYGIMDRITKILADHLRQRKSLQIDCTEENTTLAPFDLGRLKQEYLDLSNNADRAVRYPLTCEFFKRNKDILANNSDQFVQEVIASYGLVSYSLDKNRTVVTQLIAHNVRLNALEGLLSFATLHANSDTVKLLQTNFAKDLLGTVYIFCNSFVTGEIEDPLFFFAYLILTEKIEWLNQYYDDWWNVLSDQHFGFADISILQNNILFLSDLFQIVTAVCWKHDQREMGKLFMQRGLFFYETAMPIVAQHPGLIAELEKFKSKLNLYKDTHERQPVKAYYVVFNSLIRYFREIACEIPLKIAHDRPTLLDEAQVLKKKITVHKGAVDHQVLNSWLTDLLRLCKSFKALDSEASTSDYQLLLGIANSLAKIASSMPKVSYQKGAPKEVKKSINREFAAVTQATNCAFKVLTDDLHQLIRKRSHKPLAVSAPSDEVSSTSTTSPIPTQEPVKAVSSDPVVSTSSKEEHQALLAQERNRHQQTTKDMTAQAKTLHKETIDKQAQQQQAELTALQEANTKKQESLAKALAQRLAAKQEKLADQLKREGAAEEKKYEAAVCELNRQHELAIQAAKDEHNNSMALVSQRRDIDLMALISRQALELEVLKNQQQLQIAEAKQKAKLELETQHQQAIATSKEIHQYALVALSHKRRAIEGYRPIARAVIPQQLRTILLEFEKHNIEAYVYGGWPRDFLLGVKHGPYSDFNIIARSSTQQVRNILQRRLIQDPYDEKLLRCGPVAIRCSVWASLRHEPCDFTVNSFICTAQGYIFDLRNNARDLGSHWLHTATDLDNAFQERPGLMLRMLQLSIQLNKRIDERDFAILLKHKMAITNMDIQLYLDHLRALCINPQCKMHLKGIMTTGLVSAIFPGLNIFGNCLDAFPVLNVFIEHRLRMMSRSPASYGGEQVLALFILISMLFNGSDEQPIQAQCAIAANHFFAAYRHPVAENDRLRITQVINRIILGSLDANNQTKLGLYSEYVEFENKQYAEQFYVPQATPQLIAFDREKGVAASTAVNSAATAVPVLRRRPKPGKSATFS